jgi:hypothetical protein
MLCDIKIIYTFAPSKWWKRSFEGLLRKLKET